VHAIELAIDDPHSGIERVELGGQRQTCGAGADDQNAQLLIELSPLVASVDGHRRTIPVWAIHHRSRLALWRAPRLTSLASYCPHVL
jgi:hypothetical protein